MKKNLTKGKIHKENNLWFNIKKNKQYRVKIIVFNDIYILLNTPCFKLH